MKNMRRPSSLLFASLLFLCSCNPVICTINGTAENPAFSAEGRYMVLIDKEENVLDSCFVEDGKFVLSCKKTDRIQYAITVKHPENGIEQLSFLPVIPDIIRIEVDLDQKKILTEESLSCAYFAFQQEIMDAFLAKEKVAMRFIDEGHPASADSVNIEFHKWMKDICTEKYLDNLDNPIGEQAFSLLLSEITPEEAIELFEKGGEATKTDSYIAGTIMALKDNLERSSTKTILVVKEDGSFEEYEGCFDDFLGNGQPVLVDFWASWCNPCLEEIPNVVKTYADYKDKGLVVIGVTVRDEISGSKSVMNKYGITYPQIISGTDELCERYGVNGIPEIILFGPDGKIIAQGLRGRQIENAVSACLSK